MSHAQEKENNLRPKISPPKTWRSQIAGWCLLALGSNAFAQAGNTAVEAHRLFSNAHQLTQGWNFSDRICAEATPLLQASLEQWVKLPAADRDDFFVRLQLAHCAITQRQPAAAAAQLRRLLDTPLTPGNGLLISDARLTLADLYAAGEGVEPDAERAFGLYLLAQPDTWQGQRHRDRAAAELIYKLNNHYPNAMFHSLLERGGAPSNWLRSIEVRRANNENRYELVRLEIAALQAAQFPPEDQAETAARQALLEGAGQGLLEWGDAERLPVAMIYLQSADSPTAKTAPQVLEKRLPYRLRRPDGSYWGHENDQ